MAIPTRLWCAAALAAVVLGVPAARALESGPPDFRPVMVLGYTDPETGKRVECGEGCRRLEVPDGVELEIRVRIDNRGGLHGGEGVAWDLWFDEPLHPFPGLDLAVCFDTAGLLDLRCWQAMRERVDRELWDAKVADRVCVPTALDVCAEQVVHLPVDAEFEGSRRPGTYHVAVWVDRFGAVTERNEFDNWTGPVRVTVASDGRDRSPAAGVVDSSPVITPAVPRPYAVVRVPAEAETGFQLASDRSRAELEFVPDVAGEVVVEVDQGGGYEVMIVTVRKSSTGAVLIEQRGRGRLELTGRIGPEHLKDDRLFAVEVVSGPGARGLRGVMRVEYPARTLYRVSE